MKMRMQQAGMSMLGVLVMVGLFSFFVTVVIRLLPPYMEGRSVKTAIEGVAAATNAEQSLGEVGKRLAGSFNTNQIEGIKPKEVKIYRDKGKIIINANYELRTPLFQGVDAVLMFTDNIVVID
jgi:type II secretory pathway pseudopilin PulG